MLQGETVLVYGCQAQVVILLQFRREKFQNQSLAPKIHQTQSLKSQPPSNRRSPPKFFPDTVAFQNCQNEVTTPEDWKNVQPMPTSVKCSNAAKRNKLHMRGIYGWLKIASRRSFMATGEQLPTDPWSNAGITTTGTNKKNPRTKGWTVKYYITARYCTWYMHVLITWCWNNIWAPIYTYI